MEYICHSCGEEGEYKCERCEQPVCEECLMEFTYMNQIDYDCCRDCNDTYEEIRADEMIEEERVDKLIENLTYEGYLIHEELTRQLKNEKSPN